jgi:GAF domain-containing protein
MRVQSIEDYPPEAIEHIAYHRQVGIRSSLGLPLRVSGRIVGGITFVSFRSTRKWPDDLIARLNWCVTSAICTKRTLVSY